MIDENFSTTRCKVDFSLPRQDVVLFVVEGFLDVESTSFIIEKTNEALAITQSVWVFNDWYKVTGYDSKSRQMLTQGSETDAERITGSHILVKSSIVAMGVAVANFLLNQSQTAHSDRTSFEDALKKLLLS